MISPERRAAIRERAIVYGQGIQLLPEDTAAALHQIAHDDVPALLTENAELRALLGQVTRAHERGCGAGAGCYCGVEADRVQVGGLLGQEGQANVI